ncbi:unnamed protein product [Bursaphelenchus okinawaensis]|uniref:Uncharacterized protein n=1 Tax=Bursaphelenchus okinawaensis TaxID=465554 RepID=A0A811L5U6_9BILA|nr:unnamed protein product [Bursaphelenchus okinawaensis]CAG9116674.1 unnamed protein product [Bursaphelenchus okinawaensis]
MHPNPPEFLMEVAGKTWAEVTGSIEYEGNQRLLETVLIPKEYDNEFKSVSNFRRALDRPIPRPQIVV